MKSATRRRRLKSTAATAAAAATAVGLVAKIDTTTITAQAALQRS